MALLLKVAEILFRHFVKVNTLTIEPMNNLTEMLDIWLDKDAVFLNELV